MYSHTKKRRRPPHLRKPPTGLLISYQLAARSWLNKSFCFSVREVGILMWYDTIISPNWPVCLYTGNPFPLKRTSCRSVYPVYFQFDHSVHGLHLYFSTQYGSVQVDIDVGVEVISLTFEGIILIDDKGDVQVSVFSSVHGFLAVAFQTDGLVRRPHLPAQWLPDIFTVDAESLFVGDVGFIERQVHLCFYILSPRHGVVSSSSTSSVAEKLFEESEKPLAPVPPNPSVNSPSFMEYQ